MRMWLPLAIIPSLLYAVTNHIDKLVLSKYFKEGGVETLMLFSTLFAFLILPYAVITNPAVLSIGLVNGLIMFGAGVLNVTLLYCYFKALEQDEPTTVILFYQLVPVIALGLGWLILGERITNIQGIAMLVIILGTTIASLDVSELKELKRLRFKRKTVGYMLVATTCWAGESTIGKIVVLDESVQHSIFWEATALVAIGVLIFATRKKFRDAFINAFRTNSKGIIGLSILTEGIYGVGNAVVTYAVALQTVALVLLFQPTQAIFVFLIGLFLTKFFPKIYREKVGRYDLMVKIAAMGVTGAGTVLLAMNS